MPTKPAQVAQSEQHVARPLEPPPMDKFGRVGISYSESQPWKSAIQTATAVAMSERLVMKPRLILGIALSSSFRSGASLYRSGGRVDRVELGDWAVFGR